MRKRTHSDVKCVTTVTEGRRKKQGVGYIESTESLKLFKSKRPKKF